MPDSRAKAVLASKQGFTLIELLVVIVIIGLLATGAILLFSDYQARARDSVRFNDIEELRSAVERYKLDQNQYAPLDDSFATLENALDNTYIMTIPHDPGNFSYQYVRDNTNYYDFFFGARSEVESFNGPIATVKSGPSGMTVEEIGTDGDPVTDPTNGIEFGIN